MARYRKTIRERFDEKWELDPVSGCWLWTASRSKRGYGAFWMDSKQQRAHRAAWLIYRGTIPRGLFVLHECDTPPCVRPGCLFLGTQVDNMADMIAKGRHRKGETHHLAKLTENQVLAIRSLRKSGEATYSELAEMYGVSYPLVAAIVAKRAWAHLP